MPFNTGTPLIGSDGAVDYPEFSAELSPDGTQSFSSLTGSEWLKVTGKAAANSRFGELQVDDLYNVYNDQLSPADGDTFQPMADDPRVGNVVSFSIELSRAEIETTTISARVRKYRVGRMDLSGTVTVLRKARRDRVFDASFFRVVEVSGGHTVHDPQYDRYVSLMGWLEDKSSMIYLPSIVLSNVGLPVVDAQRQESTYTFRLSPEAPDDITIYDLVG
jgi:hypothetical protein